MYNIDRNEKIWSIASQRQISWHIVWGEIVETVQLVMGVQIIEFWIRDDRFASNEVGRKR